MALLRCLSSWAPSSPHFHQSFAHNVPENFQVEERGRAKSEERRAKTGEESTKIREEQMYRDIPRILADVLGSCCFIVCEPSNILCLDPGCSYPTV